MTIRFYLKRGSEIIVRYRFKDLVFQYATAIKIDPSEWDGRRIKSRKNRAYNSDYNQHLDQLENHLREIHARLLAGNALTKENIRAALLEKLGKVDKPTTYLSEYMYRMIEERKGTGLYRAGSLKVMNTALQKLVQFERDRGTEVTFDEVNMDFFHAFIDFLEPRGYKKNFLNKVLQVLKMCMTDAFERNYHTNQKYRTRKFTISREEVFNVYLDESELKQLYDAEMTQSQEQVRDLFLIACYTGLRYSDISRLSREHFQENFIHIIPLKDTRKRGLVIPVHPVVRTILQKYEYRVPRAISNQKMNAYLKQACKAAGIDMPIIKEGKAYRKYELITTHTGRRSFATNAFKAGIPALAIMKITGHTTESSFMKYIKITAEENAILMASNPFFSMMRVG